MFELVKLQKELTDLLGGPQSNSLVIKETGITISLYRRRFISNTQLTAVTDILFSYKLKIGTIKAVPHGVLSSEIGLEIYFTPLK